MLIKILFVTLFDFLAPFLSRKSSFEISEWVSWNPLIIWLGILLFLGQCTPALCSWHFSPSTLSSTVSSCSTGCWLLVTLPRPRPPGPPAYSRWRHRVWAPCCWGQTSGALAPPSTPPQGHQMMDRNYQSLLRIPPCPRHMKELIDMMVIFCHPVGKPTLVKQ